LIRRSARGLRPSRGKAKNMSAGNVGVVGMPLVPPLASSEA
jgi:hypothetical protein